MLTAQATPVQRSAKIVCPVVPQNRGEVFFDDSRRLLRLREDFAATGREPDDVAATVVLGRSAGN